MNHLLRSRLLALCLAVAASAVPIINGAWTQGNNSSVPEPSTLTLGGLSMGLLALRRLCQRKTQLKA